MSKKNLMEIVKKLMVHMERAEGTLYRDELLTRMIEICAQNNYQHVVDFEWYITVLAELTEMETSAKHGTLPHVIYLCLTVSACLCVCELLRLCVIVSTCVSLSDWSTSETRFLYSKCF